MPKLAANPSRMDRRISLRYPIRTRGAAGGIVETWVDAGSVWAEWLARSGREFYAAQRKNAEASGIFTIRHRPDVAADWQIVNGDDLFEVIDVQEEGRRDLLNITVRALNQSPGSALSVLNLHDAGEFLALHDTTGTPLLLHPAA